MKLVKWSSIETYYKRSLVCNAYKIYDNLSSPLLKNLISKTKSRRETRNLFKVDLPTFKYIDYKRSFSFRAAIAWNNTPNSIREKDSFDCFKYALKKSDILDKINFNLTGRALLSADYVY